MLCSVTSSKKISDGFHIKRLFLMTFADTINQSNNGLTAHQNKINSNHKIEEMQSYTRNCLSCKLLIY
jgi:hypothetical protein